MRLVDARTGLEGQEISLCTLLVGGRLFGIETARVREVLGRRPVQRVPLAPDYLGGIVAYRGEVLTAVSLRAVLGLGPAATESLVLVIGDSMTGKEAGAGESFGLMVDAVGGVVRLGLDQLAANPSTLDERGRALFDGAFRVPAGLLVRLDARKLRPERLRTLQHEWSNGAGCD